MFLGEDRIKKVYLGGDRIKSVYLGGERLWSAEEIISKSVSVTQAAQPSYNTNNADQTVPNGYSTVTLSNFVAGTSYGETITKIIVYRPGVGTVATLVQVLCAYSGYDFTYADQVTPTLTYSGLQDGDILGLHISANYNPNVSGAHTSTASVTYTFT